MACALAGWGWAQSAQEEAAARQREAVERQRASLAAQGGSLEKQKAAVELQRASAMKQPAARAFEDLAKLPVPVSMMRLDCAPLAAPALDGIVGRTARANGLSPGLLRAVIERESAFEPCAVSKAGAMGMMQLMPATAEGLGVADPFDAGENIAAGGRLLRQLLDRFGGDLGLALGAYNAGPGRVEQYGGIPPFAETQSYVEAILNKVQKEK